MITFHIFNSHFTRGKTKAKMCKRIAKYSPNSYSCARACQETESYYDIHQHLFGKWKWKQFKQFSFLNSFNHTLLCVLQEFNTLQSWMLTLILKKLTDYQISWTVFDFAIIQRVCLAFAGGPQFHTLDSVNGDKRGPSHDESRRSKKWPSALYV